MSLRTETVVPVAQSAQPAWLELVRQHVAAVRYGFVHVIVHEGRVIQIEKTERVRLDKAPQAPEAGGPA